MIESVAAAVLRVVEWEACGDGAQGAVQRLGGNDFQTGIVTRWTERPDSEDSERLSVGQ
jgi:hypothetical protein